MRAPLILIIIHTKYQINVTEDKNYVVVVNFNKSLARLTFLV